MDAVPWWSLETSVLRSRSMVAWVIASLGATWVVMTELDTSSCVSLRRLMEVFVFVVGQAACTWKSRALFLYDFVVSGSPFLSISILLVKFGTLDSSGVDFVRGAMFGSTLDTLSAPVLALRRISHNFYVDVDSVRYFSLFSRRIEKVLSRCFARVLVALLALGNLYIIPTSIRGCIVV